MNSIVAPNIKRLIKESGMKQKVIAERAGYSAHQLSAMVNGRKLIQDTDVVRIAQGLGVEISELFKTAVL